VKPTKVNAVVKKTFLMYVNLEKFYGYPDQTKQFEGAVCKLLNVGQGPFKQGSCQKLVSLLLTR
jgi:hypothetical protein